MNVLPIKCGENIVGNIKKDVNGGGSSALHFVGNITKSVPAFYDNCIVSKSTLKNKNVFQFVCHSMIMGSFFTDDSGKLSYYGKTTPAMQKFVEAVILYYNKM